MTVTNDSAALNVRSARTRDPEGGLVTGARSEKIRRAHVRPMWKTCARRRRRQSPTCLQKGSLLGTPTVSHRRCSRTPGLLGCLGGFRLDRGLWLLGSFNIFTIVTTNLCNSNMFRDQHFGDVSWGDPNNQREDWWAMRDWTVGEERSFWGNGPGCGPAVRGQGLSLIHI